MPKIHLTTPEGSTLEFDITRRVTFGRAEGNDIVIPHGSVSSNHGEFLPDGDNLEIVDTGSTNGTFINGERVQGGVVAAGGSFKLGSVDGVIMAADGASDEQAGSEEESGSHGEQTWNEPAASSSPITGLGATPCPAKLRVGFGPKAKVKDSSGSLIMALGVLSILACAAAVFMIAKMGES